MLENNSMSLEVHSDSEDDQKSNTQKPNKIVNSKEITGDESAQSQTGIKTSNEDEEDDTDDDDDEESGSHCINPSDYIDINQTKYFDATVILSSFINLALSILLLVHFYDNKQWTFFGVSLSFHIFSHLCYIGTFYYLYEFTVLKYYDTCLQRMITIIYLIVLLLFSPLINLLIYLTSVDYLILTHVLKPIVEKQFLCSRRYLNSSWHEYQADRLVGYVYIETLLLNIPQAILALVVIGDCISSSNHNSDYNYNSSIIFLLFLTFFVNLFCIIIKSYIPFGVVYQSYNLVKELVLYWTSVVADVSTAMYIIICLYVPTSHLIFFLISNNFLYSANVYVCIVYCIVVYVH